MKKSRATTQKTSKKAPAKKAKGAKKSAPSSLSARIKESLEKMAERIENVFSSRPKDIVSAIKLDHEGLRNFLDVLKDTDRDMSERRRAYELFSALLKSHTTAEEELVYKTADQLPGREMHLKVTEGYVEHQLAEDLMKRIESTEQAMDWSAHANVLSEIVEHHLKEEERDLLPLVRKATPAKVDQELVIKYLALREKTQSEVTKKNAGVLEKLRS